MREYSICNKEHIVVSSVYRSLTSIAEASIPKDKSASKDEM